jgi:hypothetical protein
MTQERTHRARPGKAERASSRELETLLLQGKVSEAVQRARELKTHRDQRAAEFSRLHPWQR